MSLILKCICPILFPFEVQPSPSRPVALSQPRDACESIFIKINGISPWLHHDHRAPTLVLELLQELTWTTKYIRANLVSISRGRQLAVA